MPIGSAAMIPRLPIKDQCADARNIGLEAFLEYDILKALNPSSAKSLPVYVNGAVIDAKYINTEEASIKGKKVEMVPPVMVRTGNNLQRQCF